MKLYKWVIAIACVIALSLAVFSLSAYAATKPPTTSKTVICGQRAYIGHGARYWYKKYIRIKTGQVRANVNLQKHPAKFRTKGCPRSIWKGHGPEYWHYKSAVLTAIGRAKQLALRYDSRPVRAARVALKYIGRWYVWGGNSPQEGFDCSGIVQYAYSQVGIYLPRTTWYQRFMGRHVWGSLKSGDILFFNGYSHEAMYIDRGLMIEAPYTGAQVRLVPVRSYIEARRVTKKEPIPWSVLYGDLL
jgi:cell wall-associated NlpC family hydrolase